MSTWHNSGTFLFKKFFSRNIKKNYGYKITPNFNNLNPMQKQKKQYYKIFQKKKISHETLKNLQVEKKLLRFIKGWALEKLIMKIKMIL